MVWEFLVESFFSAPVFYHHQIARVYLFSSWLFGFGRYLEGRQAQFLTIFFAENKEKFSSTILDVSIDVSH